MSRCIRGKLLIAALLLLAASCRSNGQGDQGTADTDSAKEAKQIMNTRYGQPFANPRLNSFVDASVKAAGRLAWKAAYNPDGAPGSPRDLYVLDGKRALLDAGDVFFAFGLADRKVLGFRRKSNNAFLALGEGAQFYFFDGYQLIRQDFDRYGERAEDFFVPGLGQYSVLHSFSAGPETFIAGVQNLGNHRYPTPTFEIYEKIYQGTARRWSYEFEGMAVMPPIDTAGSTVVAQKSSLTVIDRRGARTEIDISPLAPVSCSIGPDGLLYLVGAAGSKTLLRVCTLDGETRWEVPSPVAELLQPPIVDADGVVYLVDSSRIAAFQDERALWEYRVSSPRVRATAFRDLRLVVADGARVVCLDENGHSVWSYEDEDGESFLTAPVLDPAGRVLVATETSIVAIE